MSIKDNVDYTEIDKFSELAADWWNPNGKLKSLHDINPFRLQFIREQISISGKKILDVGCGGGILSESLFNEGGVVTAIDLATEPLKVAKQHAELQNLNINYQEISVEELATREPLKYDIITCMELLEHVPDPESIIQSCSRLLKPNGLLFLSTINRNTMSYLQAIIAAEYILKIVPKKTHDSSKFIQPSELGNLCRNHHLNLLKIKGFTYNPLTKKYKLYDKVKVNYLLSAVKN